MHPNQQQHLKMAARADYWLIARAGCREL